MIAILQFLAIPAVKYAATVLGVVSIFGLWLWRHDARVAEKARTEIVAEATKDAEKKIEQAEKARGAAARPGAAERLRRSSCRNC